MHTATLSTSKKHSTTTKLGQGHARPPLLPEKRAHCFPFYWLVVRLDAFPVSSLTLHMHEPASESRQTPEHNLPMTQHVCCVSALSAALSPAEGAPY